VSVSLHRHGHLTTVAASDRTIEEMDAAQYDTGQGPCVDASLEGQRFYSEALDVEQRWPSFTPRARALGINAILSSPLLASERPVGALNIYSRSPSAFGPDDRRLASVFASEASVIVADVGTDVSEDQEELRIRAALRTRQIIAQAQGVLMERQGIAEDMAYRSLLVFSQTTGRPLRDRAIEIVTSTTPSAVPTAGDDRCPG
jgi:GAF domain-containing protein